MRRLVIDMHDARQLEGIHLAQISCAQDRCRSIPLEHRQRIRRLCAMCHVKTFELQGVCQSLGEEDVTVDQEDFGKCRRTHARTSADISRSMSRTSTISFFKDSNPHTYDGNFPVTGSCSASVSSHSPVTGIAVRPMFTFP